MKLNQHFRKLLGKTSLGEKRLERIKNAHSHLKDFVQTDNQISESKIDMYVQGSYALGTTLKPQKDEFDVDIVLVIDLNKRPIEKQTPKAIIEWVAERARLDSKWKDKIKTKNRCVRVDYAGDFHLDIVPAIEVLPGFDEIYIPSKDEDSWNNLSNPIGFIKWFKNIDNENYFKVKDTTKLFKYWASKKFGVESRPKSILLTTLIGLNYVTGYNSLAETFTKTIEKLKDSFDIYSTVPWISNPSLSSENLTTHWNDDTFNLFKSRLESCASKAREALDQEDLPKSKELWSKVFPDFPQDISEDAKFINESRKSNKLFVNPAGFVSVGATKDKTTKVYDHKYFGST